MKNKINTLIIILGGLINLALASIFVEFQLYGAALFNFGTFLFLLKNFGLEEEK